MSKKSDLQPNTLLTDLLAKHAADAMPVMGYIAPNENEGYIALYRTLADLTRYVEIKVTDIVHSVDAPVSLLPFGGVIVWIAKDSEVIIHKTIGKYQSQAAEVQSQPSDDGFAQINAGRLFMKVGKEKNKEDGQWLCIDTGKCTNGCGTVWC